MHRLYDRHLGADWPQRCADPKSWEAIDQVDDGELWETHATLRTRMIQFARRRAAEAAQRRGEPEEVVEAARQALSLDALTIGFARRFATYKRATLVMRDIERIAALVNDPQRPIQFIFAGKAHPRDTPGKGFLSDVAKLMRDSKFAGKLLFIEDYDIDVGRHLVQGVDVWLNTPRRPLEASGTSGQKVVLNGGLNLSILDGWWSEAYDGLNGFAIGAARHLEPRRHEPRRRGADGDTGQRGGAALLRSRPRRLPRGWIARMKRTIRTSLALQRRPHAARLRAALLHTGGRGTSADMRRS